MGILFKNKTNSGTRYFFAALCFYLFIGSVFYDYHFNKLIDDLIVSKKNIMVRQQRDWDNLENLYKETKGHKQLSEEKIAIKNYKIFLVKAINNAVIASDELDSIEKKYAATTQLKTRAAINIFSMIFYLTFGLLFFIG